MKCKTLGFTLIELSIVLVIIGLIAGGILVGRDLIKAAEIRATIAQIEALNTAIRTFQGKYNNLPGDIPKPKADGFGFFSFDLSPQTGFGDGNGHIESSISDGFGNRNALIGETASVWRHLGEAKLLAHAYGATIDPVTGQTVLVNTNQVGLYLPAAKLGRDINFRIVGVKGRQYYWLTKTTSVETTGQASIEAALTPSEAYGIDAKLDDGLPNRGTITAAASFCLAATADSPIDACWVAVPIPTTCLTGGSAPMDNPDAVYALAISEVARTPGCGLQIRLN